MDFFKRIFEKLFSKVFFNSLPWVFLVSGTAFFAAGTFGDFDNPKWAEFLSGMGKTIIAGGILTLLLKSMQFMGIIKDELSKIVSDSNYLENRNDLPEYWDRVTRVLFENKFPLINSDITQDIKDTYLPTKLIHYYESCTDILEIELLDQSTEEIKVVQKTSFYLIPSIEAMSYSHPYKNEILVGEHCTPTLTLDHVKINEESIDPKDLLSQKTEDGTLTSRFTVKVKGLPKNSIEYQVTKTYSMKDDNVIAFKNSFIHHNYRVQIFLKGVDIDFYEAGTISKFKTIYKNHTYIEMQFDGLLYKGQGYIIFLKKAVVS